MMESSVAALRGRRGTAGGWLAGVLGAALLWAPSLPAADPGETNAAPSLTAVREICGRLAAEPDNLARLRELHEGLKLLQTDADRARFGAICYLGCLNAGKLDVARGLRVALQRFPDVPEQQAIAPEALNAPCEKCNGAGQLEAPCPACGGHGRCLRCRGGGTITVPRLDGSKTEQRCPACRGNRACGECAGTGKVGQRCAACGGSGQRLDAAKVKAAYLERLQAACAPPATNAPAAPPAAVP